MPTPEAPELQLFRANPARTQPRAQNGRFVRVYYSPQRLKILKMARKMRAAAGLPESPFLYPYGVKQDD
jgi:hypothetical protein